MVVNSGTTYFLEWDNAFDSSAFAFEFTFTPFSSENCNNPVRFNADSVSSTSAYLSWQSVENGSDFTIEYGPFGFALGSGDKVTGTVGVDGPPVELTGLTDGTFYQAYLYESCQTKGNTDTLDVFFRTDFACRTARAFTFNEDSIAPDFVRIDWTSFNEGSTFHLEYGLAGFAFGSGTRISGIVGTDGPPVSIAGLTERTEYDYYYFESCSEGNSDTLGAFNFTTTAFCPDPDNIVMSSQSDSTVSIDWDSDNNSTFTIEYGSPGFTPGTGIKITGNTADKPITISGLTRQSYFHAYLVEDCSNGYASDSIPFTFYTTFDDPTNDSCSTAMQISCGNTYTGSTENATNQDTPEGYCGTVAFGPGVWFQFEGNNQANTFSLCNSNFNTELMVFEGNCDSLICIGGNGNSNNCPSNQSEFSFESEAGKSYFIFVGSVFGATGIYELSVSCGPICEPKPDNDNCENASQLTIFPEDQCQYTSGSNQCATTNPDFNFCGFLQNIQDVWYQFTPQSNNAIAITMQFSDLFEFNIAFYDSCGTQASNCYNNMESNVPQVIEGLNPGQTYYLQVWNNGGEMAGNFDICVSETTVTAIREYSAEYSSGIFPNPASNQLKFSGINGQAQVQIIDIHGKIILENTVDNNTVLDISNMLNGMYQVMLTFNGKREIHRLVKSN